VALPDFTESGDLPIGVHTATLSETLIRFGDGPARRRVMALRLERIYRLAQATENLLRFVVYGSFVTAKAEPNDVDIFMVMSDTFDVDQCRGETRLLFDHAAAQALFGGSVFWVRRLGALGGVAVAIEYWQVKRDRTQRGIVEIVSEE
jgi:Family of unknown function (DUF6932)